MAIGLINRFVIFGINELGLNNWLLRLNFVMLWLWRISSSKKIIELCSFLYSYVVSKFIYFLFEKNLLETRKYGMTKNLKIFYSFLGKHGNGDITLKHLMIVDNEIN